MKLRASPRRWHFLKGVQSTWGELYTILGDDAPAESSALGNQSGFVYVQLQPCELHLTKNLLQSDKVLVLQFCVGSNIIQPRLRVGFEILDNASMMACICIVAFFVPYSTLVGVSKPKGVPILRHS
jgi:hypothetical protein